MFENFWGNAHVTAALEGMIEQDRIAQTLLFAGPEGIGKATLARRFGARLLGGAEKIENDDLSLPHNAAIITGRRIRTGSITPPTLQNWKRSDAGSTGLVRVPVSSMPDAAKACSLMSTPTG